MISPVLASIFMVSVVIIALFIVLACTMLIAVGWKARVILKNLEGDIERAKDHLENLEDRIMENSFLKMLFGGRKKRKSGTIKTEVKK